MSWRDKAPLPAGEQGRISISIRGDKDYCDCVTARTFVKEIRAAKKAYDHHVVALAKSTEEFKASLDSLVAKAIQAYENRGEGMRHGIALDKEVTVILSQADGNRPLCGIYFNLHSPYHGKSLPKTVKPIAGHETTDGGDS